MQFGWSCLPLSENHDHQFITSAKPNRSAKRWIWMCGFFFQARVWNKIDVSTRSSQGAPPSWTEMQLIHQRQCNTRDNKACMMSLAYNVCLIRVRGCCSERFPSSPLNHAISRYLHDKDHNKQGLTSSLLQQWCSRDTTRQRSSSASASATSQGELTRQEHKGRYR
jgi:hypothetical protein